MYCSVCGSPNLEGARFCEKCGSSIGTAAAPGGQSRIDAPSVAGATYTLFPTREYAGPLRAAWLWEGVAMPWAKLRRWRFFFHS
jgi:predicted amidophosphoribosyltransferase